MSSFVLLCSTHQIGHVKIISADCQSLNVHQFMSFTVRDFTLSENYIIEIAKQIYSPLFSRFSKIFNDSN